MLAFFHFILLINAQYDGYYDIDGDLIPIEDLPIPTELVTTLEPPRTVDGETADGKNAGDAQESKSLEFNISFSFQLVKYGTLTCGNGLLKLDIFQKDVMLIVMACILVLERKIIFQSHKLRYILVIIAFIFGTIHGCKGRQRNANQNSHGMNQCKCEKTLIL